MKKRENNPTITPEEAGKMLGMSGHFLRRLLREGKMENVGFAVQNDDGNWRYYVYRAKVESIVKPNERAYGSKILSTEERGDEN